MISKNIYFYSVILFTKRLRDIAIIKDFSIIKVNLNIVLRDIALL